MQRVAVFAACRSVSQCVAVCCSDEMRLGLFGFLKRQDSPGWHNLLQHVAVCCSMLQCAAVCRSVLQCAAVCHSVLVCKRDLPIERVYSSEPFCSTLQRAATHYNTLHNSATRYTNFGSQPTFCHIERKEKCVCLCVQVCVCAAVCVVCLSIYTYIYISIYVHVYAYIYVYTYVNI